MRKATLVAVQIVVLSVACFICVISRAEAATGEIKITGSTTFAPLIAALTEAFTAKNKTVKITFTQTNVADSIKALIDGNVDIGCAARYIKPQESEMAEAKGIRLECRTVALDCIIPIVNPANNIKSIGLTQLNSIFKGKTTNWKDFDNGSETDIKVIVRESGSAMYDFWQDKVMRSDTTLPGATTINSNRDIVNAIAQDRAAIGYTSFSYLGAQVKAVPLIGFETFTAPTESHPLSRKLLMCTNGKQAGVLQEFVDFISGPEGKQVMQKSGYIPY